MSPDGRLLAVAVVIVAAWVIWSILRSPSWATLATAYDSNLEHLAAGLHRHDERLRVDAWRLHGIELELRAWADEDDDTREHYRLIARALLRDPRQVRADLHRFGPEAT